MKRKMLIILSGMAMTMFLSFAMPSVSRAYVQASGIVTADAAKVRKEPSTQSDSMSSLLKGTMVTVIDEAKDSAGALWYKVSYENSTGYIRSDLMLKATTTESSQASATDKTNTSSGQATLTTTTGTNSAATAASKPAATQVTTIAETKAYVNYKSARVRQGASTQHEIVGSAAENTPVVITGEANGSDGRKWYQIRYTNQNGREVVGFIRADLVTVGDPPAAAAAPAETPAEAPAEAPAEQPEGGEGAEGGEGGEAEGGEGGGEEQPAPEPEPAPEETARPDYEMVYQANSEGVEEWFLLDNVNNTQQSLENLRMWADTGERLTQEADKQGSIQKIIIIVLAALAAILAVTVAILLFKLKDVYEDEDDDEDEDDEDDEDDDEEDEDEEEEEEEVERVVRRKRPAPSVPEKPERAVRTERPERPERPQRQERPERAERPQRQTAPASRPAAKARPTAEKERRPVPMKKAEYEPEDEFESGQPAVQKPQPKRKPKNFLIEDDEFEFEFLNMDDKK